MSKQIKVTDRRLLAALEHIDQQYIDDVFDIIKEPEPADQKSSRFKVWKQVITLAACLVLMAAAFPVIKYVIENSDFFAGSIGTETPETTNGMYDEYILTEEDLAELNEAYFKRKIESNPELYADMSEEELNQIKNSKYGKYAETVEAAMYRGTEQNTHFYFGKYDDCIVVAINGMIPVGFSFELCGYTIGNRYTTIYACYDSTFYYIPKAYEMGLLSDYHIQKMDEIYSEYYLDIPSKLTVKRPSKPGPIELTDAEMRRIAWAYIKNQASLDEWLEWTYTVSCYAKSDGIYAVMIDCSGMFYTDAFYRHIVNEVEFVYSRGNRLRIYKDGAIYSLDSAFEKGIIDEEYLLSIEWSKHAAFTYTQTSYPIELMTDEIADIVQTYSYMHDTAGDKGLHYSVRCYGTFHSSEKHIYVVDLERDGYEYKDGTVREEVNGLVFEYPAEQAILVYPWEKYKFYSLTEAFESGLLTADELYQVYSAYNTNE